MEAAVVSVVVGGTEGGVGWLMGVEVVGVPGVEPPPGVPTTPYISPCTCCGVCGGDENPKQKKGSAWLECWRLAGH